MLSKNNWSSANMMGHNTIKLLRGFQMSMIVLNWEWGLHIRLWTVNVILKWCSLNSNGNSCHNFFLFKVILHDAVRPFVDEQTLRNVTMAAKKHGVSELVICGWWFHIVNLFRSVFVNSSSGSWDDQTTFIYSCCSVVWWVPRSFTWQVMWD